MTESLDAIAARLTEIERRLARLEAKEQAIACFNRYTYSLDVGFGPDLLDNFTDDAVLEVINFPPGSGQDLRFVGREEMAPLYAGYSKAVPLIKGGHHTTNLGVWVADDASHAEISAYFATSGGPFLQGGMYQLRVRPDGAKWRTYHQKIISGWGWTWKDVEAITKITEPVEGVRAWRDGRPATFDA